MSIFLTYVCEGEASKQEVRPTCVLRVERTSVVKYCTSARLRAVATSNGSTYLRPFVSLLDHALSQDSINTPVAEAEEPLRWVDYWKSGVRGLAHFLLTSSEKSVIRIGSCKVKLKESKAVPLPPCKR
jgi:hypothetical protein